MRFIEGFTAAFISIAFVSTVHAQPTSVLVDLGRYVEEGQRVRIVHADGSEIIGDISTMGPDVIDVEVKGRMVRLGDADVREIGVLDSPRNGILIGLGAGLAAGLATGLLFSQDGGNLRGLAVTMSTAAGGGLGIGVGAAIDALNRHYHTVYRAPSRVVRVSPVVSPAQGFGVVVAIGW